MMGGDLIREFRIAARGLAKSPTFTLGAGLTLALALGAGAAVFSLVDRVVLQPLPFEEPGHLVAVDHPIPEMRPGVPLDLSVAGFFHLQQEAGSLESLGVYVPTSLALSGEGPAFRLPGAVVSASLLRVLRAPVLHGRALLDEDNLPGAASVVILGYGAWTRLFGGDPNVVGRTVTLDGTPTEVVGILAPGFHLPTKEVDVWLPLTLNSDAPAVNSHFLVGLGRMAGGSTLEGVRSELDLLTERFPDVMPNAYGGGFMEASGFRTQVRPLSETVVGDSARILGLLLAAAFLVLVVAMGNVTNLFLVRAETRRKDTAIQAALGAGRRKLMRRDLQESLLLTLPAAGAGLLLGWGSLRVLLAVRPDAVPRISEAQLTPTTVLVVVALAMVVGGFLGALPHLRARKDWTSLREGHGGPTSTSRAGRRVRGVLVVAQVALAVLLVASSGLLLRTVQNFRTVDPGFTTEGILVAELALPAQRYPGYDEVLAFHREVVTRAESLPGVVGATGSTGIPTVTYQGNHNAVIPEGFTGEMTLRDIPIVGTQVALPGHFDALGIQIIQGRVPDWSDVDAGTGAVVVTEALARRLWPGEDPVGKGIQAAVGDVGDVYYRVVGVVGEFRAQALDGPLQEVAWFPPRPIQGAPLWSPPRGLALFLKVEGIRPEALAGDLTRLIGEIDPELPMGQVRSLDDIVSASTSETTFASLLLAFSAGLALVLSLVGLYAVVAYTVSQRRGEIGIRMALGASSSLVGRQVVLQAGTLGVAGVLIGLGASLWTGRLLESQLFGISATDPLSLAGAGLLLLVLTFVASLGPALRAASVDPAVTLRAE